MAENAIEYGESLLADIRKRNKDARRTQERKNRQNQWKQFALNVAYKIGEDYTKNKQLEFLNNEEALKQQMLLKDSNDSAEKVLASFDTAKTHVGGEQAYFDTQLKTQLDTMLSQKYGQGSRNETTYQQILNKLVRENSDAYYEGQVKLRDLSRDYAASGNAEAYKENRKTIAGDGTIAGTIANKLSKLTGILDVDLYKEKNADIVKKSEAFQTNYQTIFNQTKDVLLAEAVAEISGDDVGVPAPQKLGSFTHKHKNIFGETTETQVTTFSVSSRKKDGKVVQKPVNMVVGPYGWQQFTAEQQNTDFTLSQAAGSIPDNLLKGGISDFQKMDGEVLKAVNDIIIQDIEEKQNLKPRDDGYEEAYNARQEGFVRNMVASGILARQGKYATMQDGQLIFVQMVKNRMQDGELTSQGVSGIGTSNIFETMFAMQDLDQEGKIISRNGLAILGSQPKKMYDELFLMNEEQRNKIYARLESQDTSGVRGTNYFDGYLDANALQKQIMTIDHLIKHSNRFNFDEYTSFDKMMHDAAKEISAEITAAQKKREAEAERAKALEEKRKNKTKTYNPMTGWSY